MGETADAVRKVACYLEDQGCEKGRIGLYGGNSFFWGVCYLAVLGYSGICFPLDHQYRQPDLQNILSSADLSLLLYDTAHSQVVDGLRPLFPSVRFLSFDALFARLDAGPSRLPRYQKSPSDTACVLFTSGTSALPKAVMLSQANLLANYDTLHRRTPMGESDRMLLTLPLHHVYAGVAAFLYSLLSGMEIYFGGFSEALCAEEFQSVRPTVYISVPLQAQRFLLWAEARGETLSAYTGGCLKYFYCGGSAIETSLKDAYLRDRIPILEAYGLSETSSVVALDLPFQTREGSTGVVFENLDVKIDAPDETGIGEILVKGASLMKGYFKNPALNAASFTPDGYFRTGDLGRLDGDRYLFLTGRKKKILLTSNGKNVPSDELEAYFTLPPICRVLVYAAPSSLGMKCWYTGDREKAETLLRTRNEQLPKYKRLSHWELIPDVPGGRMK